MECVNPIVNEEHQGMEVRPADSEEGTSSLRSGGTCDSGYTSRGGTDTPIEDGGQQEIKNQENLVERLARALYAAKLEAEAEEVTPVEDNEEESSTHRLDCCSDHRFTDGLRYDCHRSRCL